jgi:hypothetical protein
MLHTENPAPHRLSVEDVLRMYEAGVLAPEERVEAIDGSSCTTIAPSCRHRRARRP